VRGGFVLGHNRHERRDPRRNLQIIKALRVKDDVISAVDIEVLAPNPGSRDFKYPHVA
jgi:hypothetical protein